MNEGLIPRRYAKALYKFASEKGQAARVYELMKTLSGSFLHEDSLQQVMANPFITPSEKERLILTASGADAATDSCFVDFIKLLVINKRIPEIRDIALAYGEIYRKANNIYLVDVTSAAPLTDDESARLRSLIERHLKGGRMEYTTRVDADLVGGFVITVDSERLDASIKNELKQLRLKLLSN